jgi:hypothetical protein
MGQRKPRVGRVWQLSRTAHPGRYASGYPRCALATVSKVSRLLWIFWRFHRIRRRVEKEPNPASYRDIATTPVTLEELASLELYNLTPAAETAVIKIQRKRLARAAATAS